MPTETTKGTERCEMHPGSVSVARCSRCDRTLCIACAVPVRGVVLGLECLPQDVATGTETASERRRPRSAWWRAVGAGLAILLGSTALPWTRFGAASGWFGAWGSPLRWSTLAALTALLAFLIWIRQRSPGSVVAWSVAVLAIAAAVSAELAISNPPPFTRASVAPWVAHVAGTAAAALAVAVARRPSD